MRILILYKRISFLLIIIGLSSNLNLLAEGTKQLKPDTNYVCNLDISNGSGFSCFATQTCNDDQKLFVRIGSPSEKIYMGFGNTLTFRIKLNGIVVYGPVTVNAASRGYIKYYKQAIAGPSEINPSGYTALEFNPGVAGDYSIEFNPTTVAKFDITVIDTLITPVAAIDGRLWSKDWGFDTGTIDSPLGAFLGTQYIYSDDSIVTSVYYNQMKGNVFDVTSTSNGCYPPPMPFDSSCRSRTGNHHYAQYKIFLSNPDSLQFPTGALGNIISGNITVTQQCDGSFTFTFWVNKPGRVEIDVEVNPLSGHQPEDVSIIDTANAGWNNITWNGLNGLGIPVADGSSISFSITYINGLTNLALYDVERHLYGFIIQLVRPHGSPIATYWNDTILAIYGGGSNLSGCYGIYPSMGCHTWDGTYGGGTLGSQHTVNSWWYAASSASTIGTYTMARGPDTPTNITGPILLCQNSSSTYTIVPDPLPGADPMMYEWILTDATTGLVLLDLTNQDVSITINFSLYPTGNKRLKVRGYKSTCGFGTFGPGNGILISNNISTQITNTVKTFAICSGTPSDILLQTSITPSTFSYTATATSASISGYSAGMVNPIQQTLSNSGLTIDSVIYRVVPYSSPCYGDTATFYVIVNPVPVVTNTITTFTQCSEETTTINLLSNIPGGSFYWTATGSSPDVSGYSAGNGAAIAQPLFNSGSSPQIVTYTVRDSVNGCSGPSKDFAVTVTPKLSAAITISPSSNPFCLQSIVTFTSSTINAGTLPSYQWKVNGSNAGTNFSSFSYIPINGDIVTCILTSSATCLISNQVTSNSIVMTLNTNFPASVTINTSDNPFCSGTSVTYSAKPTNGGASPSYQWKVNGSNSGTNSDIFMYSPVVGDVIQCSLSSNLYCVTGSPASSNQIVMTERPMPAVTFIPCFDTITSIDAQPIKLKGGIPLSGTYSGSGVNSLTGIYTPSIAGTGPHLITYSYTNSSLCTAVGHTTITNFPVSSFVCGDALTDIRDARVYQTIQLGSQCWFAEDLNYGVEIPVTQDQRDNCIPEKYHNPASGIVHPESVYQWDELMQYDNSPANQGICPPAWHIPTETEWNTLFSLYISNGLAGAPLKYSGYSGFNVLLSGTRHINTSWDYPGFAAFFWTSTSLGFTKAWSYGINEANPSVSNYPSSRVNAFSVRCLKD